MLRGNNLYSVAELVVLAGPAAYTMKRYAAGIFVQVIVWQLSVVSGSFERS